MRLFFFGLVAVAALLACSGFAQDFNKGAGTTEREVSKGTGHDRTYPDGAAPTAAPDGGDAGVISM